MNLASASSSSAIPSIHLSQPLMQQQSQQPLIQQPIKYLSQEQFDFGFRTRLKELTFNSKPIITSLSELAGQNQQWANIVVLAISDQLKMAPSDQKLPLLYLMDSILKNEGNQYPFYFRTLHNFSYLEKKILSVFPPTYQSVNPADKERLKVFQTFSSLRHFF